MDGLTPEKTESFLEMLQTIGHESPVEHVSLPLALREFRSAAGADYPTPHCLQRAKSALCP